MMFRIELAKKPDESELQYIYRIGNLKSNGTIDMTWSELADIMNKQLREPDEEYSESVYRKRYKLLKDAYEQIFSKVQDDDLLHELTLQKQEIQKEKRKLYDERLDLNRRLREEARLETTIEKLGESLKEFADEYFPPRDFFIPTKIGNKIIVCILVKSLFIKNRLKSYYLEIKFNKSQKHHHLD